MQTADGVDALVLFCALMQVCIWENTSQRINLKMMRKNAMVEIGGK